jgi:hypothetical protein
MRKYSKKSTTGAEVLEPIKEAPGNDFSPVDPLLDEEEIMPLEPEEVGIKVYVTMLKHSKSARKLAAIHYKERKVTKAGTILLPDGQTISVGATVKTEMLPALKAMLRDGVLLAGKAPRRS